MRGLLCFDYVVFLKFQRVILHNVYHEAITHWFFTMTSSRHLWQSELDDDDEWFRRRQYGRRKKDDLIYLTNGVEESHDELLV